MEIRSISTLRGPNSWAPFPVLTALVDLGALKDCGSSNSRPRLVQQLLSDLPGLTEHRCARGEGGRFCERLRRGTNLAHVLEHVTIELQRCVGHKVGFGRTRASSQVGVFQIAVEFDDEAVARTALSAAHDLCRAAIDDAVQDISATLEYLRTLADGRRLDADTLVAIEAAQRRNIPILRCGDNRIQFGYGARQTSFDFVHQLFATSDDGRVPIVAVTGVNGKTTTTSLIAHILQRTGICVGKTTTEGVYIDGQRIATGDSAGADGAREVLQNDRVQAAVLETARGGILTNGLGFDRCQVAVVTNIAKGDHLGLDGVETVEQLARVKRTVVDALLPHGAAVLNAADPLVAEMQRHCKAEVVFFCRHDGHPTVNGHLRNNGRAVFVRDGSIVLAQGNRDTTLTSLASVPLTQEGRIGFQIENALAATAAAWSLGLSCAAIRSGLASFQSTMEAVPGRFNLAAVKGGTVVVDYGHNPSALTCILEALAEFPPGERTAVFSANGDRRDADIIAQGKMLGDSFDRVILYEDPEWTRGRRPGEILSLLLPAVAAGRRVAQMHEFQGANVAAHFALATIAPGELVFLQAGIIDETIALVRSHMRPGEHEVMLSDLKSNKTPNRESPVTKIKEHDASALLWKDASVFTDRLQKSARALVAVHQGLARHRPLGGLEQEFLDLYAGVAAADADIFTAVWRDPRAFVWVRVAHELLQACLHGSQLSPLARRYVGDHNSFEALAEHLDQFKMFALAVAVHSESDLRFQRAWAPSLPVAIPATPFSLSGKMPLAIHGISNGRLEATTAGGKTQSFRLDDSSPFATSDMSLHRCPVIEDGGVHLFLQPHAFNMPALGAVAEAVAAGVEFQWQQAKLAQRTLAALARHDPETFAQFKVAIHAVALKPQGCGNTFNTSHSQFPGAFTASAANNPLTLADDFIHEFHHNRLFAIEERGTFFADNDAFDAARFYSPWRDDPRPLHGILHAVYVFTRVCRFWLHVYRDGDLSAADRSYALDRLLRQPAQFELALHVLRQHAAFTDFGQRLFDGLVVENADLCATIGDLDLPRDAAAFVPNWNGSYSPQLGERDRKPLTVLQAVAEHCRHYDTNRDCVALTTPAFKWAA